VTIWGAAEAGDLAEVQRLVGQDPRWLNATNYYHTWPPLMYASKQGHVDVVRFFGWWTRGRPWTTKTAFGGPPSSSPARTATPPWCACCWRGGPTPPSSAPVGGLP
jgi:hypothetical protein